ncbi:hypothetical protein AW736_08215 [Termitidicoccus mucosus]|uniref:Uncharacterized protein n=1 Tax=Termitidicoccus mucosus TaxID=1184151 RepID=A0A178IMR9_9BACT|nr:hypothetical protein AW736_08215 [Opitutaceae bacterium TSB47]
MHGAQFPQVFEHAVTDIDNAVDFVATHAPVRFQNRRHLLQFPRLTLKDFCRFRRGEIQFAKNPAIAQYSCHFVIQAMKFVLIWCA